jgi:hypothetical protein
LGPSILRTLLVAFDINVVGFLGVTLQILVMSKTRSYACFINLRVNGRKPEKNDESNTPTCRALSRNFHFFEERHGYCTNILGANSESRDGHYQIL